MNVNIDVVLDASQNQGTIITQIIDIVTKYFSPANRQMGENVYVSDIRRQIQALDGVISISDIQFFNKVGGQYSSFETSMQYADPETKLIQPVDDTIFAEPSQIYQVRFPTKDISIRLRNLTSVNFS